jgi:hypothetical protein
MKINLKTHKQEPMNFGIANFGFREVEDRSQDSQTKT